MQSFAQYRSQSITRFGRVEAWRTLTGLLTVAGVYILITGLAIFGIGIIFSFVDPASLEGLLQGELNKATLIAFLGCFAGAHIGVWIAAHALHQCRYAAFWGVEPRFQTRRFLVAAGLVFLVIGSLIGLSALIAPPTRQLEIPIWLTLLLPTLLVLLIQTSAEELLFRGYLQPLLATRFTSPLIWWVIPAILFGALHWQPSNFGPNAWLVVVAASIMGLITGDVTARTGNISAAFGLHFANNAIGLLVVATPGDLSALSLFIDSIDPADTAAMRTGLLANIGFILTAYALWLLWLRRRTRLLSSERPTI